MSEMGDSHDKINHPPHYCHGTIECIEYLEDQEFPGHLWNAVQYIARCRWKGSEIDDVRKAIWYLNRYIQLLEKKEFHPAVEVPE